MLVGDPVGFLDEKSWLFLKFSMFMFQAIWESKQVTAIELRFERPGLFNVDGEILEHDGLLRLRVLPQMMDMLVQSLRFVEKFLIINRYQ